MNSVITKRAYMGIIDSMMVKYGATMVGYTVVGLPVFGPNREEYFKKVGDDPVKITKDYIRNTSLLINLAKAVGRAVVSYKEAQLLAGYTTLVYEMVDVFDDLDEGKYRRNVVANNSLGITDLSQAERGEVTYGNSIKLENVPIYAPNGDKQVNDMNIEIKNGMHTMIVGPNGCGKSSLFRMLGNLWPIFKGKIQAPHPKEVVFVPQVSQISLPFTETLSSNW